MMLTKMLRLEQLYISGHMGLKEYTRGISRLALDSLKRLEKRDPFQRYPKPGVITQDYVEGFKRMTPEELTALLYSDGIFKR